MFEQRLIILFSVAVAARSKGRPGVRWWVLRACAVSGRSGGRGASGYCAFAFSLS